ncbi:hypothetical protein [Gordonia humi]|uniref:Uncharacterized protein n=1 Tax=Gordonia humi TaxID=686429 RepID=A0A840F5S0_9ACTN|nr:hypothetical protein [Gordonia humi]MBB4137236.1 hypothetical protein [Gordonia humi]
MTDTDLIRYLAQMRADAEARGDQAAVAWCRNSTECVHAIDAQMQVIQGQILALIPKRERSILSVVAVTEAMKRLNEAVDAAAADAERVAAEALVEDQRSDWYKRWAAKRG